MPSKRKLRSTEPLNTTYYVWPPIISLPNLSLLAARSQRRGEARLVDGATRLEPVGAFDLDLAPDEKPEGIAFESGSRLVVVTDDQGRLLRYSVTR